MVSGNYTFWISSADHAELWLGLDSSAGSKVRIAHVPGWINPLQWTKYPAQQSIVVNLQAGQAYYLEILHKANAGSNHLEIGWRKPGETGSGPSETVPSDVLSAFSGGVP